MATERLPMNKIREILRQKLVLKRSHREVVRALGISVGTVSGVASRAKLLGLDWPAVEALSDEALEVRLYGPRHAGPTDRPAPDPVALHVELRRPGVTLQLLHLEYLEAHPNGYRYTKFCALYSAWLARQRPTMRQTHRAGDKLFVDYSGKKPVLVDPTTGEVTEVELFVAVLGASNLTYAEATRTQGVPDWVASNVRALEFFGGVPRAIVPDQLKSGVTVPCVYEPGIQRTYEEFAHHYGTTILPARPAHPRDKAKVEVGVQVAQRWILARLRNQRFFTLADLNARIAELRDDLNARRMRTYGVSRRALFDQVERAALAPLPAARFTYAEWRKARVHIDYHVQFEHHFYSVPFALVHEAVEVRATAATVEVFLRGTRVAAHPRSFVRGAFTTTTEHMPVAHQRHAAWTPARMRAWAATIGPATAALIDAILAERRHPEHGYRSCLGILRLAKKYGDARLEAACDRGLALRVRSYRSLASMLEHGLERTPLPGTAPDAPPGPTHENVRGPDYYH